MTGVQIVIGSAPGRTLYAKLQDGDLADLTIESLFDSSAERRTALGDVVAARVLRVLRDARGLIVDLGADVTGFVPWVPGARLWTATGGVLADSAHEGLTVLAQVTRLGIAEKGPRLSAEISLPGRWAVFIPGGPGAEGCVRASHKLPQTEKSGLKKALTPALETGEALILRSAAAGAGAEPILHELSAARKTWRVMRERAAQEAPPLLLWRDADVLERVIRDWSPAVSFVIRYDDANLTARLAALTERFGIDAELERVSDALAVNGLPDMLDRLAARRVPLRGRGEIVIDATEALTAIDVNGGGEGGVVTGEAACLDVNRIAAREIARQIRLRDIGGLIVIDFLPLKNPPNLKRLMTTLKGAFKDDEASIRLGSYSEFGTLEMTRQRSGRGMLDRRQEVCSRCAGTGRVPSLDDRAIAMLGDIHARGPGGPVLTATLGPELFGWVTARRQAVEAELARFGHGLVTWVKDEALAPRGWRVDQ